MADARCTSASTAASSSGSPTGVGRYLSSDPARVGARRRLPRISVTIFAAQSPPPQLSCATVRDSSGASLAAPTAARGGSRRACRAPSTRADLDVFFAPGYTAPLRLAVPAGRRDLRRLVLRAPGVVRRGAKAGAGDGSRGGRATRGARRHDLRVLGERDRAVARRSARAASCSRRQARRRAVDGAAATRRPPLVLFVGSLFNRRHIPELIDAFRARRRARARRAARARRRQSHVAAHRSARDRGRRRRRAIASSGARTSTDAELDRAVRRARACSRSCPTTRASR